MHISFSKSATKISCTVRELYTGQRERQKDGEKEGGREEARKPRKLRRDGRRQRETKRDRGREIEGESGTEMWG